MLGLTMLGSGTTSVYTTNTNNTLLTLVQNSVNMLCSTLVNWIFERTECETTIVSIHFFAGEVANNYSFERQLVN